MSESNGHAEPERAKVFLVLPIGGPTIYRDSDKAFELAARVGGPAEVVARMVSTSSGPNFDYTWTAALNYRDKGLCDHLAMVHADVAPPDMDYPDDWLQTAYREKVKAKVDLISFVIPMKDFSGRTSTAIGSRSDPWKARHLTGEECNALPVTFTTKDVTKDPDEVLLINNGLWLCDLRQPWCDEWIFDCVKKREVSPETGQRQMWFRSEDWEMSRFMDARGATYAATTAVNVGHWGYHCFRIPPRSLPKVNEVRRREPIAEPVQLVTGSKIIGA